MFTKFFNLQVKKCAPVNFCVFIFLDGNFERKLQNKLSYLLKVCMGFLLRA